MASHRDRRRRDRQGKARRLHPSAGLPGACNAPLAREGLQIEPDLGLLLPCNVVVRADEDGRTLVSALNPEMMVSVSGRPELEPIASDAKIRLARAARGDRPEQVTVDSRMLPSC